MIQHIMLYVYYEIESEMSILGNTFNLSQFEEYREDNRREVKKLMVVCRFLCGTRILFLQTAMVVSLSLVLKKKKMELENYRSLECIQASQGVVGYHQ